MSKDLNICTFVGRLTKDAQSRYSQNGTAIASFVIAVNNLVSDNIGGYKEEPNYLNMFIIGKRAESIYKYLIKGQQVAIQAEARQNTYKRKDGTTASSVEFLVFDIQLLGKTNSSTTTTTKPQQQKQINTAVDIKPEEFEQAELDLSSVPF